MRSLIAIRRWYRADVIPLIGVLMFLSGLPLALHAQRNSWKTDDIRPLTKLPWLGAELRPVDVVLDEIFREPNEVIRYSVLHEYLSMIPVEQLGEAYDKCVILEGTQTPDALVEFFLRIWARRNPHACWEKTKDLFDLVGIEHGFLGYDSYVDRPKITVQNRDAIRASGYWIQERAAVLGFAVGVQQSTLPEEERVSLMKECSSLWFARFKAWPGERLHVDYTGSLIGGLRAFELPIEELRNCPLDARDGQAQATTEIALRRWLEREPKEAPAILDKIVAQNEERKAYEIAEIEGGREVNSHGPLPFPSREWLLLWRRLDPEGILAWAKQARYISDPAVLAARGMLLSRVDANTRELWLKEAKGLDENGQFFSDLLGEWSIWDVKSAMDEALAVKDAESAWLPSKVQHRATRGFVPLNLCHANLGFIREFDVEVLRKRFDDSYLYDWATESMEKWGRIDVGEAARYGLEGLMKLDFYPRSELIQFFKGENNEFSDTGDMIDRTFCCLRVWAVVRPDEMKAWIPTIQDPVTRDALTYILEHPWGDG